jgi:hypothetical protein
MSPTFKKYIENSHAPGAVFDPAAAGSAKYLERRAPVVADKDQIFAIEANDRGTKSLVLREA